MKFRELFAHMKEIKHYLIASALVFFGGMFMGWEYSGQFDSFLQNQLKGLEPIISSLNNKENPQLWFFLFIFINNASKAVLFLYLGLFFGILPLFMLVVNGMILGYLLSGLPGGELWGVLLKGILPHGIIEIPAIILACAFGLRLGILVTKSIIGILLPAAGKRARTELVRVFKLTKPLILVLVVSLLVAAVVESTITFWLVHS